MTDERLAFERSIADSPDDLALRLVFADWLDERSAVSHDCPTCHGSGRLTYDDGFGGPCSGCCGSLVGRLSSEQGSGRATNGFRSLAADHRLFAQMQAVIADPENDAPRLEWARIAEAYGREERAEFVRVQCEMAKLIVEPMTHTSNRCAFSEPDPSRCDRCRFGMMMIRENQLKDRLVIPLWPAEKPGDSHRFGATTRRGFFETVTCTLADFLTHGRDICRNHPVTQVRISDRRPMPLDGPGDSCYWVWGGDADPHWRRELWLLPPEIYLLFEKSEFANEEAAMLALSEACIAWARSRPTTAPPSSSFGNLSRPPELSPPVIRD